jgi:hypothetical protein
MQNAPPRVGSQTTLPPTSRVIPTAPQGQPLHGQPSQGQPSQGQAQTLRPSSTPTVLPRVATPGARPPSATPTILPQKPDRSKDDPIELVDEEPIDISADISAVPASKIHGITAAGHTHFAENYKRTPTKTNTGAIRMRSFYGRLSDQGLGFLDHSINDWLDKNPDIEIKQVTSTVGLFEGKLKELALILNLWY